MEISAVILLYYFSFTSSALLVRIFKGNGMDLSGIYRLAIPAVVFIVISTSLCRYVQTETPVNRFRRQSQRVVKVL